MSHLGKLLLGASTYVPTTIGEAWGGGFYAGRMKVAGESFAVVVSPNALGYNGSVQFSTDGSTPSGLSPWNGAANHDLMTSLGLSKYPGAQWCAGLNIGGFTDWHIPAEYELDICYRAFRPANAPNKNIGENVYADPPKGNYTDDDPPATTLPAWSLGGSEEMTANYFLTSTAPTASSITIMNFNGGVRINVPPTSNRVIRATRLVRIVG